MPTVPSFGTRNRPARSRAISTVVTVAATLVASLLVTAETSTAAEPAKTVRDGSSQSRAAVSCWDIKQLKPKAKDGRYWLLTPQLKAPSQFYCDMTTEGGGWVLVGRGREGWSTAYNGKGTPDQVSNPISGKTAFAPKQLDANVINALFAGQRMDAVAPEVRVKRAKNAAGTKWQYVKWRVAKAERWTWALEGGVPLTAVAIDGKLQERQTTTRDIRKDVSALRLWTHLAAGNGYVRGFNYGSAVAGTTKPSSYLFSKTGKFATPFAQIFVRPKLRAADVKFAAIPDAGAPAITQPAVAKNGVKLQTWGVRGSGSGGEGENGTEVQAFTQVGTSMIAGGNFTQVVKGENATGADVIDQPYLAAFDSTTANYVSSFKPPRLNGQVKSLAALPAQKIAVGGEFTTVGGKPRAGLVVLDGRTGAVDTAWTTQIENRLKGGKVSIRGMKVAGDYLYLGGAMTHIVDGAKAAYAKGAGRIKISTREADAKWNPEFNGTVTALDTSADGKRAYFAGYFTNAQDKSALKAAAFSTTAQTAERIGADWTPKFSSQGAQYQQAIREAGGKIWVGGAQHSLFSYDAQTFALKDVNLMRTGGDLQALATNGRYLYGGCHCENVMLEGIWDFDNNRAGTYKTGMQTTAIDAIDFVGAWDPKSGRYVPDFSAKMKAREGRGIWAIQIASDGTLWTGGALRSAVNEAGRNQWTGGFARFGIRDTTPAPKPSGLKVTVASDGRASVDFNGVAGATRYDVLRNDRVVASTGSTNAVIESSKAGDKFFVRSVDAVGNRSASTARVDAVASKNKQVKVLSQDMTYKYLFSKSQTAPSAWKSTGVGTEKWKTGPGPLGWGEPKYIKTNIDVADKNQRAITSYHTRTFTVKNPSGVAALRLRARADDGVAIYINGVEVNRTRLPDGKLTSGTYATEAVSTASALANPINTEISPSVLKKGTNTIAVEVHSNFRSTTSHSMAVELIASIK